MGLDKQGMVKRGVVAGEIQIPKGNKALFIVDQ
ncbi:MAG: hypothetical protein ACI8ZB_002039 [Desulforhopalus sp.]|jgi:hypothetical protein